MIATGLTFLLGALVTTLIVLVVAPLVWRKAQSLARREFEATIPVTANEIRADFDRVRAEAALSVRRTEILAAEARERTAQTQAELGRSTVENVELLKRNRKLAQTNDDQDEEMSRMRAALAVKEEEQQRLTKALAASRSAAELASQELEALGKRFAELGQIAEERKIQLIAAETRIEGLADSRRSAERTHRDAQATIERLRAEAASFDKAVTQERTNTQSLSGRIATLLAGIADRDEEIARLKAGLPASAPTDAVAAPVAEARPPRSRSVWGPALPERGGTREDVTAGTAEIREQLSDIAARVIRMTALAQGSEASIAGLAPPPRGAPGDPLPTADRGTPPNLAERVRRLVEAERAGHAAPGKPIDPPAFPTGERGAERARVQASGRAE